MQGWECVVEKAQYWSDPSHHFFRVENVTFTQARFLVGGKEVTDRDARVELRPLSGSEEWTKKPPQASRMCMPGWRRFAGAPTVEDHVRAAYLRITEGRLLQYVRLAVLQAVLSSASVMQGWERATVRAVVNDELVRMQNRGVAVLYPIDDPRRRTPEDDAAFLAVSGERRDLVCITER